MNTEEMLKALESITGIKPERDENGMINMTKFVTDYRDRYPVEFQDRFGDASADEVINLFFSENN